MPDSLLFPAVALCMACVLTVLVAQRLDRAGVDLPLPLWFLIVSLSLPMIWLGLQAVVVRRILSDPNAHARFISSWPLYVQEVLLLPAFKLWICGALCAAVLAYFRRPKKHRRLQALSQLGLLYTGGAIAAAIFLSVGCSKP